MVPVYSLVCPSCDRDRYAPSGPITTLFLFLSCLASKGCVDQAKEFAVLGVARHTKWLNVGDGYWIVFLGQYTTLIPVDALLLAVYLGIPRRVIDTNLPFP